MLKKCTAIFILLLLLNGFYPSQAQPDPPLSLPPSPPSELLTRGRIMDVAPNPNNPDERYIASASGIWIGTISTGELRYFESYHGLAAKLRWSPSGDYLAIEGRTRPAPSTTPPYLKDSCEIYLWDVQAQRLIDLKLCARLIGWEADNQLQIERAWCCGDRYLPHLETGLMIHQHEPDPDRFLRSPDGSLMIDLESDDPDIVVLDQNLQAVLRIEQSRRTVGMRWSADSSQLMLIHDRFVEIWHIQTRTSIQLDPELIRKPSRYIDVAYHWYAEQARLFRIPSYAGYTYHDPQPLTMWIFDTDTGDPITSLDFLSDQQIDIAPDGRLIAIHDYQGEVTVLDPFTGETMLHTHQPGDAVRWVEWHPSSILIVSNNAVRQWDLNTGTLIAAFDGFSDRIGALDLSPDGRWLAAGMDYGAIRVWDMTDQSLAHQWQMDVVIVGKVAWSPDGGLLATDTSGYDTLNDQTLVWSIETGALKQAFINADGATVGLSWSPDGDQIAVALEWGALFLLDIAPHRVRQRWYHQTTPCAAWSPDGAYLITTDETGLALRDAATLVDLYELLPPLTDLFDRYLARQTHPRIALCPVWRPAPHDRQFAVGVQGDAPDRPTHIQIYHLNELRHEFTLPDVSNSLSFDRMVWSPDGAYLAVGGSNIVINVATETLITLERASSLDHFAAFQWSPDGRYLAGSGDYRDTQVYIWDGQTGARLYTLTGHTREVSDLRWLPDGKTLVSAGWDGTIRIWSLFE